MTRRRAAPQTIARHGRAAMPMTLPTDWSPEQAVAVFEILDELRERVWAVYGLQIQGVLREQHRTTAFAASHNFNDADEPF